MTRYKIRIKFVGIIWVIIGGNEIIMKRNLLAFVLLFAFLSCKKSSDSKEEGQASKRCLIESVTSKGTYGDEKTNFTYDDKGRVIKVNSSSINYAGNLVLFNFTYEYSEKRINIYYEYVESGKTYPSSGYYELDSKGRIIKRIDEGIVEEEYEYDSNDYLIGVTDGIYKPLVYENSNLIRSGTRSPYTADNYYTSEPLLQGEFDFARLYLLEDEPYFIFHNYFGKASKNLIKSRREDYGSNSKTTTYSFTKDEKGNINKMVKATGTAPNISTEITDYTYKCF